MTLAWESAAEIRKRTIKPIAAGLFLWRASVIANVRKTRAVLRCLKNLYTFQIAGTRFVLVLIPFVGGIQVVRGLFGVVVFAIFLVKKGYQPPDSKQDEANGNQQSGPDRKGW